MVPQGIVGLLAFSGVLLLPVAAWAQSPTTGAIAGVVRDSTGGVLPGVTVEAASPALIEKVRTVISDGEGRYQIVDLRPGAYTVTFTLTGFNTVRREGIELSAGFTAAVNGDMRVGALEETVTVTGASPVVDTQNVRTQSVLQREVLDTLPTNKSMQGFASLIVGMSTAAATGTTFGRYDVGGNKTDAYSGVTVHGLRMGDGRMLYNGMRFNNMVSSGGGSNKQYFVNQQDVQEVVLETSGGGAENENAGVHVNMVPRSGGNTFTGSFTTAYTNGSLQSNNLSDELRARGLQTGTEIKKIYDVGGGVGGPLKQDRLWFYTAHRGWGNQDWAANNYHNKTPGTLLYTPDLDSQGFTDFYFRDHTARLTWQATQKHKLMVSFSNQHNCNCHLFVERGDRSPEATTDYTYFGIWLGQATWTYPATQRLLFQAGATHLHNSTAPRPQPGVLPEHIATTELTRNYTYNAPPATLSQAGYGYGHDYSQKNQYFSVSYIPGSHAFKVGIFTQQGVNLFRWVEVNQALGYQVRNGVPVSLTEWASPGSQENRMKLNLGLYAQDQWTINRLTLNLGVRFDYFNAYVPAQSRPAGRFVPAFEFAQIDNVGNFTDLSPRLGAAYDLFGNGKTAVKFSVGRYVTALGAFFPSFVNPANTIVQSTNRTWNDVNGNAAPDCDLNNRAGNGECGAIDNAAFGTVRVATRYAKDVLEGFSNRENTWTASASVQHELLPRVSVNVGYFRTWYGNFLATDNLLVTPADYDPFCITAPRDPRLPGGGGQQVCGLGDIKPEKFGQVDNVVTQASHFGGRREIYDGVDATISGRFATEGLFQGGMNVGRTWTQCVQVDAPIPFCKNVPPFFNPEIKFSVSYPLPWDVQASAVFQSVPGIPINADYVATNAEIAPSLGRNLAACGNRDPCTATYLMTRYDGTIGGIDLKEPNQEFEDRSKQLDLRFAKNFRVGRARIRGMFDIYNIFNGSNVGVMVTRFGPAWLRPTEVMAGRLLKFGAQLDF
jgi:hypothetical protein